MIKASYSLLTLKHRASVLEITLDDQKTSNALSAQMIAELIAALSSVRDDGRIRTIVLRGANGVFCAGANLKTDRLGDSATEDSQIISLSKSSGRLYNLVNEYPAVVIAVVEGAAFGGGMGLASCADIVICTPRARFSLSETTIGLVAAQIAPFVVGRIGLRKARILSLTGSRVKADEAFAMGLVDYCCGEDEVENLLAGLLQSISRCAPKANAATKKLLLSLGSRTQNAFIDYAADVFADALNAEGKEGIAAFTQRRSPAWVEVAD